MRDTSMGCLMSGLWVVDDLRELKEQTVVRKSRGVPGRKEGFCGT
jgi:hypothetical protein